MLDGDGERVVIPAPGVSVNECLERPGSNRVPRRMARRPTPRGRSSRDGPQGIVAIVDGADGVLWATTGGSVWRVGRGGTVDDCVIFPEGGHRLAVKRGDETVSIDRGAQLVRAILSPRGDALATDGWKDASSSGIPTLEHSFGRCRVQATVARSRSPQTGHYLP